MHFITATATLIGFASTSLAATAGIKSNCNQPIYLTYTDSDAHITSTTIAINGTYSQTLGGKGNQFGIAKNPDYFTPSTPKLVLGFSDSTDKLTYWSVSTVDGNPEISFLVSASDTSCSTASTIDSQVHTCTDTVCRPPLSVFEFTFTDHITGKPSHHPLLEERYRCHQWFQDCLELDPFSSRPVVG